MKNQYLCDKSDYFKYALLAALQSVRAKGRLSICWMLTEDDDGPDGNDIKYHRSPDRYRDISPAVFDLMKQLRESSPCRVETIAGRKVLPSGTHFYPRVLSDATDDQLDYFDQLAAQGKSGDLIFFDPDNGMEVKSLPQGKTSRKRSSKYLYRREFEKVYRDDVGYIVFQHHHRGQKVVQQVKQRLDQFSQWCDGRPTFAVRVPKVSFLVCPTADEYESLRAASEGFSARDRSFTFIEGAGDG